MSMLSEKVNKYTQIEFLFLNTKGPIEIIELYHLPILKLPMQKLMSLSWLTLGGGALLIGSLFAFYLHPRNVSQSVIRTILVTPNGDASGGPTTYPQMPGLRGLAPLVPTL